MKTVLQGEKRSVGMKVDGNKVAVKHVTLNKPTDSHYELNWTFDFEKVSREDLIRLATRGLVIDQRPKFKAEKDAKKLEAWDNKTFSVADLLAKERVRLSPVEKASKAVASLGADEQIALLQALLAQKGLAVKEEPEEEGDE